MIVVQIPWSVVRVQSGSFAYYYIIARFIYNSVSLVMVILFVR